MVAAVAGKARAGDVVVAMSNGAFGGIWDKLLAALRERTGQGTRSPRFEPHQG
jgi:UDP-N-acetylmuramate: L-alanyl-gamma-D-glutamyl-meso-diaminopimelate ligase